jgi:hypothetical protein
MTAISVSAPPKLPVWQAVRASYVIVAHNLGQLLRICWVWFLIMVPVYAGLDWLDETWSGESSAQATYRWMREIAAAPPSLVDLPFLASIAVAWHRLVLLKSESRSRLIFALTGSSGAMSFMPSCFFCWSVEPCSSPPFSR